MHTPPTDTDRAQLAALGAALRACAAVKVPLSAWRRDLEAARAIADPTLRARAALALAEAQIAAFEEMQRQGVTP